MEENLYLEKFKTIVKVKISGESTGNYRVETFFIPDDIKKFGEEALLNETERVITNLMQEVKNAR